MCVLWLAAGWHHETIYRTQVAPSIHWSVTIWCPGSQQWGKITQFGNIYLISKQFHRQRCDHRTERGRYRDASWNSEQCVDILNTHKTCSLTIIVNVDCVTKNDAKLENIDKDIYLGVHINMWLRKIYRYLRRLPNKICDIIFFSYWSLI